MPQKSFENRLEIGVEGLQRKKITLVRIKVKARGFTFSNVCQNDIFQLN